MQYSQLADATKMIDRHGLGSAYAIRFACEQDQSALERLASEFAAVDNTDKDSAVIKLEKIIDDNAEEAA